jgi:hypothetical protein
MATSRFDPWGPISTVLYEINDSEFVLNAVSNTGVNIEWHPLTNADKYSNSTRIRAFRQDISRAYSNLSDDDKGQFARIVVKAILNQLPHKYNGDTLRSQLVDRLHDIGWLISDNGILQT